MPHNGWTRTSGEEYHMRVNKERSTLSANIMGISQGLLLGPLLFSMNITALPERCPEVGCQAHDNDRITICQKYSARLLTSLLSDPITRINVRAVRFCKSTDK